MIGRSEIEFICNEIESIESHLAMQQAIADAAARHCSHKTSTDTVLITLMEDRLTALYVRQRAALMKGKGADPAAKPLHVVPLSPASSTPPSPATRNDGSRAGDPSNPGKADERRRPPALEARAPSPPETSARRAIDSRPT